VGKAKRVLVFSLGRELSDEKRQGANLKAGVAVRNLKTSTSTGGKSSKNQGGDGERGRMVGKKKKTSRAPLQGSLNYRDPRQWPDNEIILHRDGKGRVGVGGQNAQERGSCVTKEPAGMKKCRSLLQWGTAGKRESQKKRFSGLNFQRRSWKRECVQRGGIKKNWGKKGGRI